MTDRLQELSAFFPQDKELAACQAALDTLNAGELRNMVLDLTTVLCAHRELVDDLRAQVDALQREVALPELNQSSYQTALRYTARVWFAQLSAYKIPGTENFVEAVNLGKSLEACRELRNRSGLPLKETKYIVDALLLPPMGQNF